MGWFFRKVIMNGIVLIPMIMWLSNATFWQTAIAALGLCALAYLFGDQYILRRTNNTIATSVDAMLIFTYLWIVARWLDWSLTLGEIAFITVILCAVEWIFHHQLAEANGRSRAKG